LKASIPVLLLCLGLYLAYFCISDEGIDPIETETIGMIFFTIIGILLSIFLSRKAIKIPTIIFWASFIFYLLTFTLPALVYSCTLILFMTAG
jgi:hypothetical protein